MIDVRMELMRIGRRKNYLAKCVKVAELLEEHETESTIRKRIFEQFVRPVIFCSYVQFNNMLNEPNPSKQLEELEKEIETIKNNQ